MFEGVPCSKCEKGLLIFDEVITLRLYNSTKKYEFVSIEELVEKSINKKIGFVCKECGSEEYLDYKEWSDKVRLHLTKKVLVHRSNILLARYRSKGVDESHGISYCGGCFGYSGDGWCLNDIINQCELGKINKNEL